MDAKQPFKIPYIGIDHYQGIDLLVGTALRCGFIRL